MAGVRPSLGPTKWVLLVGCSTREKLRVRASSSSAWEAATNTPASSPFSRRLPGFSTTFLPCTKPAHAPRHLSTDSPSLLSQLMGQHILPGRAEAYQRDVSFDAVQELGSVRRRAPMSTKPEVR